MRRTDDLRLSMDDSRSRRHKSCPDPSATPVCALPAPFLSPLQSLSPSRFWERFRNSLTEGMHFSPSRSCERFRGLSTEGHLLTHQGPKGRNSIAKGEALVAVRSLGTRPEGPEFNPVASECRPYRALSLGGDSTSRALPFAMESRPVGPSGADVRSSSPMRHTPYKADSAYFFWLTIESRLEIRGFLCGPLRLCAFARDPDGYRFITCCLCSRRLSSRAKRRNRYEEGPCDDP